MKSFELYEPTTVNEDVSLLDKLGATGKALGGGSDLITGVMKDWVQGRGMPIPAQVVDLTTIAELNGIRSGGDGVRIGATTSLTDIVESQELQQKFPVLTQAAQSVASPLIRNFGTLRGN